MRIRSGTSARLDALKAEIAVFPRLFSEAWALLAEPERQAWVVWQQAKGQVDLLQPNVAKSEDAHLVLRLEAVDRVMSWHSVPRAERPRVWDGVRLLHDLTMHDGKNHGSIEGCYHGAAKRTLSLLDEKCPRCRARWSCDDCGEEWAFHSGCGVSDG